MLKSELDIFKIITKEKESKSVWSGLMTSIRRLGKEDEIKAITREDELFLITRKYADAQGWQWIIERKKKK